MQPQASIQQTAGTSIMYMRGDTAARACQCCCSVHRHRLQWQATKASKSRAAQGVELPALEQLWQAPQKRETACKALNDRLLAQPTHESELLLSEKA
jgi:hypothetical protein